MKNSGFGDRLRTLMAAHGLNEQSLAEMFFVSQPAVSKWKHGSVPRAALVKRIADYFGASVEWLLHGTGEPPKPVVREGRALYLPTPPSGDVVRQLRRTAKELVALAETLEKGHREEPALDVSRNTSRGRMEL